MTIALLSRSPHRSPALLTPSRAPPIKSQGEIEAAICAGINRFEQECMGRGAKDVRAHLNGDLLVVRLAGVLTAAEQHLAQSHPTGKGRDLIKQVRTCLFDTVRPTLESMILEATGFKVLSLHYDICFMTAAEIEIIVAILAESPDYREAKQR